MKTWRLRSGRSRSSASATVCFSTNMVWSRVLTRTEFPESLAFFSGIYIAVTAREMVPLTPRCQSSCCS